MTREQLAHALEEPSLVTSFRRAHLQLADVWEVFDRLSQASADHAANDSVDLSDFVAACVSYDMPVKAFEFVAIRTQMILVEERLLDVYSRVRRLAAEANSTLQMFCTNADQLPNDVGNKSLKDWSVKASEIIAENEHQIASAIAHLEQQVQWGPQSAAHEREHLKHDNVF